jgi:purine-binding chemotaxis protein CheW
MSNPDVVTCMVDGAIYAVPVTRVQEVIDTQVIAPMPSAPAHLLGIIDLRGANVPILDLRCILGRPWAQDTPQTRILIVWMGKSDHRRLVGLRSDSVIEVTQLDDGEIKPMEGADMLHWHGTAIIGFGRREGAVVSVLDLDNLFSTKAVSSLAAVQTASAQVQDDRVIEGAQ